MDTGVRGGSASAATVAGAACGATADADRSGYTARGAAAAAPAGMGVLKSGAMTNALIPDTHTRTHAHTRTQTRILSPVTTGPHKCMQGLHLHKCLSCMAAWRVSLAYPV